MVDDSGTVSNTFLAGICGDLLSIYLGVYLFFRKVVQSKPPFSLSVEAVDCKF